MTDIDVSLNSNGSYWTAAWYDAKGRRHRKGLGSKATTSPRAARKAARQWAMNLAERPGLQYGKEPPKLAAWLDFFKAERKDLKPVTLAVYQQTMDKLLAHFGPEVRIDRIDKVDAATWHNTLPENHATRAKHSRAAKTIFGWAVKLDLIGDNPFTVLRSRAPKTVSEWHYVTLDDLAKLIEAAPTPAWINFLSLCRLAGLRRGEALRLHWSDIDFERRLITVKPEGAEGTKQRYRVVPITPDLYAYLNVPVNDEQVCPGVGPNNIDRTLRKIIGWAGLEPWPKLIHTLRKNLESDWMAKYPLPDVAAWLGHSIQVAHDSYHQTTAETMAKATGGTP